MSVSYFNSICLCSLYFDLARKGLSSQLHGTHVGNHRNDKFISNNDRQPVKMKQTKRKKNMIIICHNDLNAKWRKTNCGSF